MKPTIRFQQLVSERVALDILEYKLFRCCILEQKGYIPDAFLLKQDRVSIKKLLCESLMVFIRHHDHFIKAAGDNRVYTAASGGIVFEMEDCSWLYGVINMGLMMVQLMFIDCGSDIDSCSDKDV
ncbi:hypothetical protein Tco_1156703 [Tanacetum coccineum]